MSEKFPQADRPNFKNNKLKKEKKKKKDERASK
jgi:hypothetical protein